MAVRCAVDVDGGLRYCGVELRRSGIAKRGGGSGTGWIYLSGF